MSRKIGSRQYTQINTETGVVDADPHRLVQMLFSGVLENISVARGCLQRQDMAGKGEAIGKAISILGGLSSSLNHDINEAGIAANLAALYEFATNRLTEANIHNDMAGLDESEKVLKELQAGWNGIRDNALEQLKSSQLVT